MTDYYTSINDPAAQLRAAVSDVFQIDDVTLADGGGEGAVRFRGRFFANPEQVYPQIRERFRRLGYTPFFRHQDGQDVIVAAPGVVLVRPSRTWINVVLFLATVISVWWIGAISARVGPARNIVEFISGGVPYAATLIAILFVHEFGHYIMARLHGVSVSLPYFIPMPILNPFGTMGAAILMKEPMPNRKVIFDVGIAGPLAGLAVAIPLLIYGLTLSEVRPIPAGTIITMEGNSLLYLGLKYLVFGRILPNVCSPSTGVLDCLRQLMLGGPVPIGTVDVLLHPIAWAAWAGLLVTMFNLLPVSQLDGGHVIYSLLGERSRNVTRAVVPILLLMSALLYLTAGLAALNWVLFAGLIYIFGWAHPPSLNELVQLDTPRRLLAIFVLILFVLLFVPVPIQQYIP